MNEALLTDENMKTKENLSRRHTDGNLALAGLLTALYWLLPFTVLAQAGLPLWTNRYNIGPGSYNAATAMALDSINNVIVTGESAGGYSTIKYSGAGVLLWTNRYRGPATNYSTASTAVAVDGSNNVIVTGYSATDSTNRDYATIKYSSVGLPLWTNFYNGPANREDQARAVAIDHSNNIIVTGNSWVDGNLNDYLTIKYSSGGVPLWTNRYYAVPGMNYDDYPRAVAVDGSNNVIVTGSSGDYCATIKYSSAGVLLWTNLYREPVENTAGASAVVVDSNNDVIVTGSGSRDTGPTGLISGYATIKYSSAGVPLWTNRYFAPGQSSGARAMAVDSSNNVIVTGASSESGTYSDYSDYLTIKYSSAGVPLWTNRYNGPEELEDYALAIALDPNGNVIVTGSSLGSSSGVDYATLAYNSSGLALWTNRYNGLANGFDRGTAVVVDRIGNVLVTGSSAAVGGGSDFVTFKYSSPPIALGIQQAENQLVLNWSNAVFSLQSAPAVTGTYTNIPGATSPCTNPITGGQQFFRLISE